MMLFRAVTVILAFALGSWLMGCQPRPEPAIATPTALSIVTVTPVPTATITVSSNPTAVPGAATTIPTTATAEPMTQATDPPETLPTATIPPSPSPSPAPAFPSLAEVPVTQGPIGTTIMSSRDHFPDQMNIGDVEPDGYNTVPPTSGRHWGAWSDCGFYNYPLPDELLVHNLEHGNIIISYNLTDDAQVAALRDAVDAIPLAAEYAIVRRYHGIPEGMVALTTWGVLDRIMGVDSARIGRFFREFPGNTGPEFPNGLPCTTGVRMTDSSGG